MGMGWYFTKTIPYLKSHSRIFLIATFCEKNPKISRFGTKKALFEYVWTGIWKKYCHT